MKLIACYGATLAVMVALDFLWLGVIAKSVYQQGIGHLMLDRPNVGIAVVFYALFAAGLLLFAVVPHAAEGWLRNAMWAAAFGFFAYATYDLTNLATLKGWPLGMSLLDMAWGCTVSVASATAGKAVLDQWGPQ